MLTPKQPVINTVLITYIDYSITENYIWKMASFLPYTRSEPLLKVLHYIYWHFMWHSCNFFTNGNFQIVDCTRFSNVDSWFAVTGKRETLPTTTHLKNMRSFAPPCIFVSIHCTFLYINWRRLPPNMDYKFKKNKTNKMAFKIRDPVGSKIVIYNNIIE